MDNPVLGPYQPQDISKLMHIYHVTTSEALIFAQADHIRRLQSQVPPSADSIPTIEKCK
jgi:hypothetical protein